MKITTLKAYTYSMIHALVTCLSLVTDWYIPLSILLTITIVVEVLDKLGKGIVLRELIALFSCFISLLMPILGFEVYNYSNALARMWVRYMPVAKDVYFDYALPALSLFTLAICWPIFSKKTSDHGTVTFKFIEESKKILSKKKRLGIMLVIVGSIMQVVALFMPASLQFVANLFYFCSFTGILYIYFTPKMPSKKLLLILFAGFILFNTLRGGMFTVVAYMGITIFSFFFLGRYMALWKKIVLFFVGVFFLLVIQSVKTDYRQFIWKGDYKGNKAILFSNLIISRVSNTSDFFNPNNFFHFYYRTNQGYNVGLVMRRFPKVVPHDNGKELGLALASSFIPRLFWPDKPEAGGKTNMKYYTGINIQGWSTNVGPLGEAYGAFGVSGGILYMFLVGLLIRWSYRQLYIICTRIPLLLFWIPVLFYQVTYSAESDTLQITNSLIKSAFFIWVLYKVVPAWFGIFKEQIAAKARHSRLGINSYAENQ